MSSTELANAVFTRPLSAFALLSRPTRLRPADEGHFNAAGPSGWVGTEEESHRVATPQPIRMIARRNGSGLRRVGRELTAVFAVSLTYQDEVKRLVEVSRNDCHFMLDAIEAECLRLASLTRTDPKHPHQ